jgi:two-component system, NarL family, nitrate/nitrite response regulator NarL
VRTRRAGGLVSRGDPSPMTLSAVQRRVLELSATGAVSSEVAAMLRMTPAEVRACLASAQQALGARSKLEAVLIALRHGLLRLPSD